jgi:hypothetical protein
MKKKRKGHRKKDKTNLIKILHPMITPKVKQFIISPIVKFSKYKEFNRPKRGRCLFKKHTHTHTIDIHIKKRRREPNKVTENITNNTQKKIKNEPSAHRSERETIQMNKKEK